MTECQWSLPFGNINKKKHQDIVVWNKVFLNVNSPELSYFRKMRPTSGKR